MISLRVDLLLRTGNSFLWVKILNFPKPDLWLFSAKVLKTQKILQLFVSRPGIVVLYCSKWNYLFLKCWIESIFYLLHLRTALLYFIVCCLRTVPGDKKCMIWKSTGESSSFFFFPFFFFPFQKTKLNNSGSQRYLLFRPLQKSGAQEQKQKALVDVSGLSPEPKSPWLIMTGIQRGWALPLFFSPQSVLFAVQIQEGGTVQGKGRESWKREGGIMHPATSPSTFVLSPACPSAKALCMYFTHGLHQPVSIHTVDAIVLCPSPKKSLAVWVLASQVAASYFSELEGAGLYIFESLRKKVCSYVFVSDLVLFLFFPPGPKNPFEEENQTLWFVGWVIPDCVSVRGRWWVMNPVTALWKARTNHLNRSEYTHSFLVLVHLSLSDGPQRSNAASVVHSYGQHFILWLRVPPVHTIPYVMGTRGFQHTSSCK